MDVSLNVLHQHRILAIIEDFKQEHQGKKLKTSELKHAFELYKLLRSTYRSPVCNKETLNWILQYIIHQACRSKEDDSDFIVELILSLVNNDGHIGFLLSLRASPDSNPYASNLEYMLYHSNRKRALFNGFRLACLPTFHRYTWQAPIEKAMTLKSPTLMLCLLRYGAVWSYLENYKARLRLSWNMKELPSSSTRLCADVVSIFIHFFLEHNPEMKRLQDLNDDARKVCERLISCCQLILKDSPRLKLRFVFDETLWWKRFFKQHRTKWSIIRQLDNQFLPGLADHFKSPLTLKHSCKIAVRKALNRNWQLPSGIYHLQLPHSLKKYLDLCCD